MAVGTPPQDKTVALLFTPDDFKNTPAANEARNITSVAKVSDDLCSIHSGICNLVKQDQCQGLSAE